MLMVRLTCWQCKAFANFIKNFAARHSHEPENDRIEEAKQKGFLSVMSVREAAQECNDKMIMKIEMVNEDSN